MSREVREIRPFIVGRLGSVLDNAILRFGSDQCTVGGYIEVGDPNEYQVRRAELAWSPEGQFGDFIHDLAIGADEIDIDLSSLALVVSVTTGYLKATDVVFEMHLSDLTKLARTALISKPRPVGLQTGLHGSEVVAYLMVSEDLAQAPLRPWRKGTWLCRAGFRLGARTGVGLFRPAALTPSERTRLGLGSGTLRYVELGDHDPLQAFDSSTRPILWVDEDLLSELNTRPRSWLGQTLQMQLFEDFIWAVLGAPEVHNCDASDMDWSYLEHSLLGRIIRLIGGASMNDDEQAHWIGLLRTDPAKMVAHVEDEVDIKKVVLGALKEERG